MNAPMESIRINKWRYLKRVKMLKFQLLSLVIVILNVDYYL